MNDANQREIFIQNIPYDINEAILSEWCTTFGPISKCTLILDQFGQSRGFAFVHYETPEGFNNILSHGPHYCKARRLKVRAANGRLNSTEDQSNSSSDQLSQTISTNENFQSNSFICDDDSQTRLGTFRDELDANLECMQIAHEHEIKILREKLLREEKLRNDAKEFYKEAEEDWRKVNEENIRLRTSLIKNVMQTFNIRRDFARRTKEQLQKS